MLWRAEYYDKTWGEWRRVNLDPSANMDQAEREALAYRDAHNLQWNLVRVVGTFA